MNGLFALTLSWRRPLSYRNQSMDWFLYDNGFRHERVNVIMLTHFNGFRGSRKGILAWNRLIIYKVLKSRFFCGRGFFVIAGSYMSF